MADDIERGHSCFILTSLLLTCVSANCPKPALSQNAQVVHLHSSVNVTCPGCRGQTWWSRANGTRRHGGTHLTLTSAGYEDEDNYTCYREGTPACTVQLLVKDDIEKPKISCYLRHPTHNITCDWQTTRELRPHATVKLIAWKLNRNHGESDCAYVPASGKFTCSALYMEGDSGRHTLSLCVIGRTDRHTSNTVESRMEELVQPDAPINVTVWPLEERPRKLRVCWAPPEPWLSGLYKLQYQVQYWVEGSPHVSNGTTEDNQFVINDAMARRRHVIRVRAKEEFFFTWSAWSAETVGTPWSEVEEEVTPNTEFYGFIMTSTEDENPKHEPSSSPIPHYAWGVAAAGFLLLLLLILGILMRNREMRLLKLKGGMLRRFFQPARSSAFSALPQPPVSGEPLLMAPPTSPDGATAAKPPDAR